MKCYLPRVYDSVLVPLSRLIIFLLIVLPFSSADAQILDTLFGNNGTVMTQISGGVGYGDEANAVLIQSDQNIVAVGTANNSSDPYFFALARYKTNGSLDSTFGGIGTVRTHFNGLSTEQGYGAAIQSDGKIIVVGSSFINFVAFGVARYNTDGSLDTTFGSYGTVRTYLNGSNGANDVASSVVVQTNGKIVVAGKTHYLYNDGQFGVVRYNVNGTLDNTFGTNGTASFFINGGDMLDDACHSVALQKDGKIVLAGSCYAYTDSTRYQFALARLRVNGTLDTTFGNNGTVKTIISNGGMYSTTDGDVALSVALQPDGKIVTAGYSLDQFGHYAFAVVRYDTNGTLDTTFGLNRNGIVRTHIIGGNGTGDFGKSVVIQPNGKIVVAGSSADALNQVSFAVARYLTNGILDYQFGAQGLGSVREFINGGAAADDARSVALQADGKIVLAGYTKNLYTQHEFSLARIMPQEIGVSVKAGPLSVPGKFELEQNYPNPFNPVTTIEFTIAKDGIASLRIYDILGREVTILVNGQLRAGVLHRVKFDASRFTSGIYFYRLVSGGQMQVKKLILMK
jgi:uncharacterized delta-60 repeat protein